MSTQRPLLFVVFAFGLVACGGSASQQAASPATFSPEDPEPTTIAEAEAQIRRARADLTPPPPAAPSAETVQPSTQSAPAGQARDASAAKTESQECRALHSLERATKALCRLTSDDDPRCKDATQALEQDRTRITCP